jgi:hypothetical protein
MPSGGVGMVSVGADMASGGANMVSGATMGSGLRTWPLTWLGGADMVSGGADMAGEVPTLQVRTFPLDADMAWRCGHGLWSAERVCGGVGRLAGGTGMAAEVRTCLWRCRHGFGMRLEVRTEEVRSWLLEIQS